MPQEIFDTKTHDPVSTENTFGDGAAGAATDGAGCRYFRAGGGVGNSRKHAADVAGAQWGAGAETARAFFQALDLGHVQLDELWV